MLIIPLVTEILSPILTPPRVLDVASGSVYLLAPVATPSNFFLSAADIRPAAL